MRKFLLIIMLLLPCVNSCFLLAQDKTPTTRSRTKTGLFFQLNQKNDYTPSASQQAYMEYMAQTNSVAFGLYRNHRLGKGLYFQPEVSYMVYNGEQEQRTTLISLVPVQMQLGFHLGWVRPFIAAGGFLNYVLSCRDNQGRGVDTSGWEDSASWGYFYGAGLDVLSCVQVHYRIKPWMADFQHIDKKRHFNEYHLGLSFFF